MKIHHISCIELLIMIVVLKILLNCFPIPHSFGLEHYPQVTEPEELDPPLN